MKKLTFSLMSVLVILSALSVIAPRTTATAHGDTVRKAHYTGTIAPHYGDVKTVRPQIVAYAPRPDACRTYNIGGTDATDGVQCPQMTHSGLTVNGDGGTDENTPSVITETVTDKQNESVKDTPAKSESEKKDKHPNNGHGNDADHNDDSNPGHSNDAADNTDDDGVPGNGHGNGGNH